MDGEVSKAIAGLVESLVELAGRDEAVRTSLRSVAEAVLAATARVELPPMALLVTDEPVPEGRRETLSPVRIHVPLPELTLGQAPPPEPEPRPRPKSPEVVADTNPAELAGIEVRCRIKAEGMRWALDRQRRIAEGADFRTEIAPTDHDLLDRARDLECYLWMNSPEFVPPRKPEQAEDVAAGLEAVADAASLVRGMLPISDSTRGLFERALELFAESQSALRVALERINIPRDADQFASYKWLLGLASREHIYIPKYMRLDDPGDPAQFPALSRRIQEMGERFQVAKRQRKKGKSSLGRILYHAKLIRQGTGGEHDWQVIGETIEELIAGGLPPSNLEIREALLPILDTLPEVDARPPGLRLVVREIDRYLATRDVAEDHEDAPDVPTAEVAEAARLLQGRSLALIGGIPHQGAREALRNAFRLSDLIWVETREHESIDRFEPIVARPEVAAVILAIRWSSHSFGEVKRFCERYGKPMVRLPGGYNPNQVAAQLIAQVSGQLEGV